MRLFRLHFLLAFMAVFQTGVARTQTFTEISGGQFIGVTEGASAWGDYDNDGDLDVLIAGLSSSNGVVTKIYRNDGSNVFTDIGASIEGVRRAAIAWGDYDNDGDLDLVISGTTDAFNIVPAITKIYRNDSGVFVGQNVTLANLTEAEVTWTDWDNDGDLDLSVIGSPDGSTVLTKMYRNDKNNVFTEISTLIQAVANTGLAWGDYDKDGDQDLILNGNSSGVDLYSKVYRNDGNGVFSDINASLSGTTLGSTAWGDFDNDGDLDILLSGSIDASGNTNVTKIYRNEGNDAFSDMSVSMTGVYLSTAIWADMDNDGDLDVFLSGATNSSNSPSTKTYRNNGNNTFSDMGLSTTPCFWSSAAAGDYDNDGDLDVLLVGHTGSTYVSHLYRNSGLSANSSPTVPSNLQSSPSGQTVTLEWASSNDTQTPSKGLTYNLRVGTTPGGSEVFSSMSRNSDGKRKIPAFGNASHDTVWTIKNLPIGTYYWTVQAVDHNFAGSGFATEKSFSINGTQTFPEVSGGQFIGVTEGASAWGDYDSDGDLDAFITGLTASSDLVAKIYRNDGSNVFTDIGASIQGARRGSVAWGDYDQDGDLDIAISGSTTNSGIFPAITKIYRNDNGTFSDINASVIQAPVSSVKWVDYDNDGDLDLSVFGNLDGSTVISKIYRNDSNGVFSDINANIQAFSHGKVSWGDYDNDGDMDFVGCGNTSATDFFSKIYRNDGGGSFTDINAPLANVTLGSVAWGDYDNDGDLDVLLTGALIFNGTSVTSKIYRNDGNNTFTDIGAALTGVYLSACVWGDLDNDGDLDIVLSGAINEFNSLVTKIYRNNGNSTFSDISASLAPYMWSSIAPGDHDDDGDLDLLFTGNTGSSYVSQLYQNSGLSANSSPTAPSNLQSFPLGQSVTLKWSSSSDAQTPTKGLTYNVRIGTTPGGNEVFSSVSRNSDGKRKIPAMGNTSLDTIWTIGNLANGLYYWSVQAIDHNFDASSFAFEQSFTINPGPPASPNLISADAGNSAAALKWNAVNENDVIRYRIYRGTSPGAVIQVDSTADTSRVITDLNNNTTYYFRVATVDNTLLYSLYSNELNVTPTSGSPDITTPAAPLNLSLTAGDGQVTLNWRQNTEIDFLRYRIYQSTIPNAAVQVDSSNSSVIDTTKIISGLTNGATYYFRVTAVDTALNISSFSNEASTTPFVMPSAPGSLMASAASTSQINLSWSAGANSNKYRIYRSQTSGSGFTQIDSVISPTTTYNNTGLSAGTLYFYFVVGVNAFGVSANSNEANAFTNSVTASFGLTNVSSYTPSPGTSVTITSQIVGTNPVAKLFYGKPGDAVGDSVTMSPSGNVYSANIPNSAVTQEGLWFRLRAQNSAGVNYYPSSGVQAISVQITDLTVITSESIYPTGINSGAYFTTGLSFNGTLDLTDRFGLQEVSEGGPSNWRALYYNASAQNFSDVTSLSGGNAYFIYHRTGHPEHLFNNLSSPTAISSDIFNNLTLKPGWNLVAWPYTFSAAIDSRDPSRIGSIWRMNGKSGWEAVTQLKPFGGYMIRNKTAGDITLGSALLWSRATGKRQTDLSPVSIQFIAESGEYRDAFNFAGTGELATESYDDWDDLDPIVIDAGVNAYFVNTSPAGNKKLSYDVRSSTEPGHIWDLVVENATGNKTTKLYWENMGSDEKRYIALIDVTHNKRVDVSLLNEYTFYNSIETKFKVVAGEQTWVEDQINIIENSLPKEFVLSQNFPNPFNPSTTIKFDVARSGYVKIKIYNILGQEIVTIADGFYETGRNYQVMWNGKDILGREVSSGVYLYRIEAGRFAKTKKMLLIK